MKKILFAALAAIFATITFTSCDKTETYAEQRDREISAIESFIIKRNIKVIDEETFKANGENTNVANNEYVYLKTSGVYMQIVNKGDNGYILPDKQGAEIVSRFTEWNINGDSLQLSNEGWLSQAMRRDVYSVYRNGATFSATFSMGLLAYNYKNNQVPAGWLIPLSYIKLGRPNEGEIAKVKLIVPHSQGHVSASAGVYACHYDLTYMLTDQL